MLHPVGAPRDWLLDKAGMLAASLKDLEGVEIVVSSGWAAYHPLSEIQALFQPWPALQARVVGRTEPWVRPPGHGAAMPERERQCRDWLRAKELGDRRTGWLTAGYYHINENVKLGLGYNFTDFSDDLTDMRYRSRGWFINLLGKF